MPGKINKSFLRILDANYNRAKEGLRVIEDIYRFAENNRLLSNKLKQIRHSLEDIVNSRLLVKGILSRNAQKDVGRHDNKLEYKRSNLQDTMLANFQRVKESLRVIEEILKLGFEEKSAAIKK